MNSPAQDALTQDLKVWSATRDMYGRLQLNLRDFFTKLSSRQRKAVHSASAKEAIGQVLLCIQEELANSSKFQSSDDNVKEITVVIDSLIEDVGMVDRHTDLDQDRPLSSLSGTSEGSWSNWSEESLPEESVVIPEVSTAAPMAADTLVAVNIDLSDLPQDEASACVPHETVVSAVNSITSTLGLQNEESSSRPPSQGHLTSVWKRLEKALSQGHIQSSQDLIEDVYQILLKGRQTVAAAKSASDSALVAMKQAQDVPQGAMVSQIIGMFAQECVRDLFLPCFKLPSSWKSGARAPLRSAAASVSCPGGLSSMARNGEDRAAESPSQILAEVLQVAMNAMVADVMNILSLATRSPMDMEAFLKESGLPGYDVAFNTPDLGLLDDKRRADSQEGSTDYSSLVSVLMIRLLSKLQNEDSLSDDMLDQCRELINKVLSELTAALGVSKTDFCPAGVNICKVFKVIYNNLLSEYGSKNSVLLALEIKDPSVEKIVVRSLISEITTDVTNDNDATPKKDERGSGCFQFLPNMKKIKSCLKRNKSGSQRKANTDGATAISITDNIAVSPESFACSVSLDEEPCIPIGSPEKGRSLFTRIRSFFKRRSSAVSPV
ncbi:uncharacterized protein LOC134089259 [Sardina pilchardus]|uniref:uncharacterized protein LOC134089259 n=1 Tax=Sardina pilchardus TaxID=27697 RepID=UPI002E0DAC71